MYFITTVMEVFSTLGTTAYSNAYFGRGSGHILLDNVRCTGTEPRLLDCSNIGIGVHNCDHSEDAGVRCKGTFVIVSKLRGVMLCSITLSNRK